MKLYEAFLIALAALHSNKLRTALTVLGNVIAVAFIIATVAGIQGINASVTSELTSRGSDVFTLRRIGFVFSRKAWKDAQRRPDITQEDAQDLARQLPEGCVVAAGAHYSGNVSRGDRVVEAVRLTGRSHDYARIGAIDLSEGRYLALFDERRRRNVCVLGDEVAAQLFGSTPCVGKHVLVGGRRYEVIGRATPQGDLMGESQDAWVELPLSTFLSQFGLRRSLNVYIKVPTQAMLREVMDETTLIMRRRHRLRPGAEDDFGLVTADAMLDLYRSMTQSIYTVLVAVVALSLVVGGIVIANIMLAVVNERTREIGIRKALGARRQDVLWQFLFESILLSLMGGILGSGMGGLFAWCLRTWSPLPTRIEAWSVGVAMLTVTVVGLLSGLGPALRASRLNPVEALRYE